LCFLTVHVYAQASQIGHKKSHRPMIQYTQDIDMSFTPGTFSEGVGSKSRGGLSARNVLYPHSIIRRVHMTEAGRKGSNKQSEAFWYDGTKILRAPRRNPKSSRHIQILMSRRR
jgi:hypothetical protein